MHLRGDAEPRRGGAVVGEQRLQAVILLVCVDVREARRVAHLRQQQRAVLLQIFGGLGLERVLVLRVGLAASDADVLNRLQKRGRAGHARELGPQPVDDLLRAYLALIERLEGDEREAAIGGALPAGKSHRRSARRGLP